MINFKNLTTKEIVLAAVIAVLVVAAVVPHFVYTSGGKDAYVKVDTATYNALIRNNDSMTLALDSLQIAYSRVSTDIKTEVNAQIRKRMLIDSVYKVIDRRLDTLYADRLSSAKIVPYEEFAAAIITIPYEDLQASCNFLNVTTDPELIQLFQAFFDTKNMEYFNLANEKIRNKPSFFNAGLSDKEIKFYDSLYLARQPYQPYVPAETLSEN